MYDAEMAFKQAPVISARGRCALGAGPRTLRGAWQRTLAPVVQRIPARHGLSPRSSVDRTIPS